MGNRSKLARFQRVTALFEEGREVVLEEDGPEGPVLVWVSKLNPFEQEEARKDGSVGRARALLMLDDPNSAEMAMFNQALEGRDREAIIQALLTQKQNEHYVTALDDLRTMPDWAEKLAVLDRADQQMADMGKPTDDAEAEVLAGLNQEYMAAVAELAEKKQADMKAELDALSEDELRDAYKDSYREAIGSQGFLTEYKITEMYFSLRDCNATPGVNGRWDHKPCQLHRELLCDSRADIRQLPEGLIAVVRDAMRELTMSPQDAGNSDAPASSSASSEQPSAEAASTPSTPTEMSPEQAGTSSQP